MIYLTADIHGHLGLDWLSNQLSKINLKEDDHLIILGDAGIVWDETEHQEVRHYYECLPCTTLFVDGNHENFDILDRMPIEIAYCGKTHRISNRIMHLMRGETYIIEGKTIFVFGGGYSMKKRDGSSPVFIWDREMPNECEYDNGLDNLQRINHDVDYILTHVAPTEIAKAIGREPLDDEIVLNDYLSHISDNNTFLGWYFGHYHVDMDFDRFHCIYRKIRMI